MIKRNLFGPLHSNIAHHLCREGRIWLCWDATYVHVQTLEESNQLLHCKVTHLISNCQSLYTFIYASNCYVERKTLWNHLTQISRTVVGPWTVGGDFNEVRNSHEKVGGRPPNVKRLKHFNDCIDSCRLMEVHSSGNTLSWSNRQDTRIMGRLDRILANNAWLLLHPEATVVYHPPRAL
ncbi:hypothetical protein QJS10_CPA03g00837 [Acorus calamus]|uniref:Endonuclease/exonuclease/phosphatase domain-containing protein n=1 Tax=Acorus calamus TaxID=4465 RepID=A0AAV9F7U7_ACOCL|nr:hypothetical protein QJS10_CPA03g00837 [Acorus calamus]